MANEVRRKRTRFRKALRLAAVIVCGLAAAWLATVIIGGRGDGRRMAATPEQVIEKLVSFGAKYETDDLGVVCYVDLSGCRIVDADLTILDRLPEITRLSLRGTGTVGPGITDAGLKHVGQLRHLHRLDLGYNPVTNEGLKHLRPLAELDFLSLYGTEVTNEGLVHLQPLRRLRHLQIPPSTWRKDVDGKTIPVEYCTQEGIVNLRGSNIEILDGLYVDRQGIKFLAGLPQLRQYDVCWSDPHDTDLQHLAGLRRLESLSVYLEDRWSNTSRLRDLGGMTGLTALYLSGAPSTGREFDPSGLAVVSKLPRLERLRLGGLTDRGIEQLPALPQVKVLDLSVSEVTGEGLRVLDRFVNLEVLSLPREAAMSGGVTCLPRLPQLNTLRLSSTPIRGQGLSDLYPDQETAEQKPKPISLAFLQRVPALQELDLSGLPLRDEDLTPLTFAPGLRTLLVGGTSLTDAALVHVAKLAHLQYFDVSGTEVTIEAAGRLHDSNPGCHITDNWCCGCLTFWPVKD